VRNRKPSRKLLQNLNPCHFSAVLVLLLAVANGLLHIDEFWILILSGNICPSQAEG
jgi:hypothetical protein